jgi:hypothetical protein
LDLIVEQQVYLQYSLKIVLRHDPQFEKEPLHCLLVLALMADLKLMHQLGLKQGQAQRLQEVLQQMPERQDLRVSRPAEQG